MNAYAGVRNGDMKNDKRRVIAPDTCQNEFYAAFLRIFNGVVENVDHNLMNTHFIAEEFIGQ